MKFRYLALTGIIMLTGASAILLPGIFSRLNDTPEISYYKDHPDLTYSVFSGCKSDPVNIDECYAAYNAAVFLADSADCSAQGKEIKRRFKRLVEHAKAEIITNEINADCHTNKTKSFFAQLMAGSK
ncbi:hypothetical protein [Enterobacter cancerogenus]